jgi:hypothetical protein
VFSYHCQHPSLITDCESEAPAFIAVTQMWYRRLEQPVRLGSWYAMNGVVFMVSLASENVQAFFRGVLTKILPNSSAVL